MKKISSVEILAINLKYYRYKLNLSQEKFAEKLESTLPYINQLENARRRPSLELLDKFSSKLNIESYKLIKYNPKHIINKSRIDSRKTS